MIIVIPSEVGSIAGERSHAVEGPAVNVASSNLKDEPLGSSDWSEGEWKDLHFQPPGPMPKMRIRARVVPLPERCRTHVSVQKRDANVGSGPAASAF